MRKEFKMSDEDLETILDACKPVVYIIIGGVIPTSPQENANRAWAKLGERMGFDHMTVKPTRKGNKVFTAERIETMNTYLLYHMKDVSVNDAEAMLVENPNFDDDWWVRYFPHRKENARCFCQAVNIYEEPIETPNGPMMYDWELAGPGGASYRLFPERNKHTGADVRAAKEYIRDRHDAVRIITLNITLLTEITGPINEEEIE